jgi:hypothetical protein
MHVLKICTGLVTEAKNPGLNLDWPVSVIVVLDFFDDLECGGCSFADVALFFSFRDFWIRTQRAAVASKQVRY